MIVNKIDEPKTFFLGMGAGKSGSTFVYRYLIQNPEVNPGPLKEMRVLSHPEYRSLFRAALSLPYHKFEALWWIKENIQRIYYRSDWNRYFNTYKLVLEKGARATGENSPGNMRISSDVLKRLKMNSVQ